REWRRVLEGMETGVPLSPSSPSRSMPCSLGLEARAVVSSPRRTGLMLVLSSSKEVDVESVEEVVTRAVAKLNIDWPAKTLAEPQQSRLDERFLRTRRSLPFFPDLHTEVSRLWNRPFSARLFIPASDNYGRLYQADLLKELDEGEVIKASDISELRRTANLSLHTTNETVHAIGLSMAALVAAERHLWLTLSDMKEKDRVFLLDAPLAPSGPFGDAINMVVDRHQKARKQALKGLLPGVYQLLTQGGSKAECHFLHPTTSGPETSNARPDMRVMLHMETTAKCICLGPAHCRGLVMEQEVATLLRKEAIAVVPPHDRESGFYSRYFIVPKKNRGLHPILDLRLLNCSVMRLKFSMLTVKHVMSQIRSEDWFVTIDLKDAYFHVSILPHHRKFLRFAFRGEAYQYWVLQFGLALSPRTFTKCVNAALAPLRLQGIRILNYIDNWLILAQSEQMEVQHRDVVLAHMKELGLRLNAKKSVLSTLQRTTYLGVVWDSTPMRARLSPARIESILTAVARVKEGQSLTVRQFQQLLGLMAAVSNVITYGLLYMRPLQWWLKTKGHMRLCLRALDMWRKPWFLSQGPVLGAPCCCLILATDASLTRWGAVMDGHPARSLWSGHQLTWHINCLEMMAVFQALKLFRPDLRDRHVLVRNDNTTVVCYINHQGGLRSHPLYKLVHQILVWSQDKLLSLRAVHLPGHLNMGADILSRQRLRPGEWMLHPEVVKQIWLRWTSLQFERMHNVPSGALKFIQLPWDWMLWYRRGRGMSVHLSPDCSAPRRSPSSSPVLARPSMVLGPDFPPRRLSVGDSPGAVEAVGVAPEGAQLIASGLSTEVVETILHSRAPPIRKLYALKWRLFTSWCGHRLQDPVNCPIGTVLEFLQDRFSAGLTHSTLEVYVAAIAAYHVPLGGLSVGKNPLVTRFLHGALRLRPPVRPCVLSWDLAVVLEALCRPPFEPIEEISDQHLTIKTISRPSHIFGRSVSFPLGTRVTYVTWDVIH
ncbi:hypothetical protein M9458_035077, partial [Cirrhinus mrigala]